MSKKTKQLENEINFLFNTRRKVTSMIENLDKKIELNKEDILEIRQMCHAMEEDSSEIFHRVEEIEEFLGMIVNALGIKIKVTPSSEGKVELIVDNKKSKKK